MNGMASVLKTSVPVTADNYREMYSPNRSQQFVVGHLVRSMMSCSRPVGNSGQNSEGEWYGMNRPRSENSPRTRSRLRMTGV